MISIDKLEEMKKDGTVYYHHTAYKQGYISRKGEVKVAFEYNGKFGKGFTVESPCYNTTRYHHITYYIFKE